MGILKNLINAKVSGNVGSMNFRKRGSQTVVAERSYSNKSKGDGASTAQRLHRSRLANIVNFYRVIAAIQARAWQNKGENVSDFNMLSKYNLAKSPIFLTKQEAIARACVIAPYEVSRGSLPTLAQAFVTEGFNVGVNLGEEFVFDQNTLGAFSQAVIDNNDGWKNGDKLSIALLSHAMQPVAGVSVPKTDVVYVELTLDVESTINLMMIANLVEAAPALNADGFMCCAGQCNAAFAIHSRKVMGVLETSSQSVVMKSAAADPVLIKYSSDQQKVLSMASYGYQADVLLTPGEVAEVSPADVKIANVTAVTYAGSPLASGSIVDGNGELVITGTDFTRKNVVVNVAGVVFVPQSATSTEQKYSVSSSGLLTITVNGVVYITATIAADPSNITEIKLNEDTYTRPQSNLTLYRNTQYSGSVMGTDLGEISCTGGTIYRQSGDDTEKSFGFNASKDADSFTISCGDVVILSGSLVPFQG